MATRQYGAPDSPQQGRGGGPNGRSTYSSRRLAPEPKPKSPDPSPPADVVEQFHKNSDLDKSRESQHHSLGVGPYNAAAGDHQHRGGDSKPLFEGMTLTGSKGGNVALANLITILTQFGLQDNTS